MNKKVKEFLDNSSNYEVVEYIGNLQQENKQLKENYERLYNENCKLREKHNINDISLLDENQKLKDNCNKLKENAEHNDKVIDKVNWENQLLKKKNDQLKDKIKTYQDPEDLTLMFMYCEEKAKDKIKELNKKYLNAVADYETIMSENKKLKKQLEDRTRMYQNAYNYSQKMESKVIILEAQQNVFINYLKDMLSDENDIFSVVRVKDVLQKYKEIIGDDK